ncbi:GDSL-type esterase/lipase family protein [Streptomyces sp. NPDC091259]|uniref:GDSL-type esterase/lipase family protein n=1 Tax=Streptomyces sp. NPDC091259 TaxID=3365976 RepID=UPI00382293F2
MRRQLSWPPRGRPQEFRSDRIPQRQQGPDPPSCATDGRCRDGPAARRHGAVGRRRRPGRGESRPRADRDRVHGRQLHIRRGRPLEGQQPDQQRQSYRNRPGLGRRQYVRPLEGIREHRRRVRPLGRGRGAERGRGGRRRREPGLFGGRLGQRVPGLQRGVSLKGEAPQADRLAAVAAADDVKVIALSIGGNDLGFADIIKECAYDFVLWNSYCYDDQQAGVDQKISGVMTKVGKSVDEIRAVMRGAGYADSSYRIVLQSYPSPIPRGAENRYTQSDWSRLNTGGCPFWNRDSDWARDSLVPQIANGIKAVAAAKGVQFLDLRDMLQGREVCAKASQQVSTTAPASAGTSEWARWIDNNESQGLVQESMHPNYFGQLAVGRCLALALAQPANASSGCKNTPGGDQSGMYLTPAS